MTAVTTTPPSERVFAALSSRGFRMLWLGSLAVNLTIWMQSVAAAWLMVSLTTSPLMVALIQTASALPSFIFALPSGVMADLVDRRRYLLLVVGAMLMVALLLCAVAGSGNMGAWTLLALTFCLGVGFALQGPAWYTAQTDAVSRLLLPSAMGLTAVSYSAARAIGPAIAGVLMSRLGALAVFGACALMLAWAWLALLRWDSPARTSVLPPEDLRSGLRGALRYVRHSAVVKIQILRTVLFVGVASALWALLPLIAGQSLGGGAGGYGLLLGCIGGGSMLGAVLLPRLKHIVEINRMMALSALVYAGATAVAATVPSMPVVCAALVLAGVAWLGVGNTNMLALQSAVPGWIRGRALAVYMLTFQGAMAAGSALWGALASRAGLKASLLLSALLMLGVLLLMNRYRARLGLEDESTEFADAREAAAAPALAPDDRRAAVAVQIEYQVAPGDRAAFLRQLAVIGAARRRDGASHWRVFRDLDHGERYVERFIVDTWDQYLRQRSRATVADMAAQRRLLALHSGAAAPRLSHYVSERCP